MGHAQIDSVAKIVSIAQHGGSRIDLIRLSRVRRPPSVRHIMSGRCPVEPAFSFSSDLVAGVDGRAGCRAAKNKSCRYTWPLADCEVHRCGAPDRKVAPGISDRSVASETCLQVIARPVCDTRERFHHSSGTYGSSADAQIPLSLCPVISTNETSQQSKSVQDR